MLTHVSVPQSGWYDLSLTYFPVEGKNAAIQRAVLIDGRLPCKEMALVEFCRVWANTELLPSTPTPTAFP